MTAFHIVREPADILASWLDTCAEREDEREREREKKGGGLSKSCWSPAGVWNDDRSQHLPIRALIPLSKQVLWG